MASRVNTNLVLGAGILIGGYLLYRWFTGAAARAGKAITDAQSSAASSTADFFESIFPHQVEAGIPNVPAAVTPGRGNNVLPPAASIMLSDGTVIPASAPSGVGAFTDTDGVIKLAFYYQGRIYRTDAAQPDSAGMYYATVQ